ncbi:hypothetical protein AX769_18505 [Frondihabitans sp. PAMC 28766]|uniref:TadE family protein n=1 Tax=Frondihabitans sp. PAMC 28766 TaxID=1795630 RepID=UPI00078CE297|nr:TadE family protein [Frondihabitans sp. PAMC 28766]AMM21775.1 hypothetical protein AX769_18505 [Frondihabitans sp. PAMC 28766]
MTGSDRGSVTVEFALVVPSLLLVIAAGVGAIGVAAQAIRLADAAGIVARAEGRGDGRVAAEARAALADGASVSVERGALTCVRLDRSADLGPLSGVVPLSARSCAASGGG